MWLSCICISLLHGPFMKKGKFAIHQNEMIATRTDAYRLTFVDLSDEINKFKSNFAFPTRAICCMETAHYFRSPSFLF